ncbi:MAG: nucleotidyltransferase family protein [Candidatus Micrarchaeia archaeon]
MDALILCGGFATRLEPITQFTPKHLLPIGGKPLLDYIIEDIERLNINRIVISTNKKFADQFEYWLNNKNLLGKRKIELVVEPALHNNVKLGAIRSILHTIENAKLNDDLLIIAGDNYYEFSLKELQDKFYNKNGPVLCIYDVKSLDDAKRFGVVELDGDKVVEFCEKPSDPKGTFISTGIYFFNVDNLNKIKEYIKDGNNPDSPGYFAQWLVKNTDVYGVIAKGIWMDIGTIDSYKKLFYEKHKEELPD